LNSESTREPKPFEWGRVRAELRAVRSQLEDGALAEDRWRELLDSRAALLAQETTPEASRVASLHVLCFSKSGERYAIETRFVREAVRRLHVTSLPSVPGFLLGIASLRAEICPVFALQRLLGMDSEETPQGTGLLLGLTGIEFGFLVDEVQEVAEISLPDIHVIMGATPATLALCRGVTAEGILILDGEALFADPRLFVEL
jgi:purine-binding chemotaxis protein CheW